MCHRIECPTCHRPSYAGCGRHVEQVLGDVDPPDRCQCSAATAAPQASRPRRRWFGGRTVG